MTVTPFGVWFIHSWLCRIPLAFTTASLWTRVQPLAAPSHGTTTTTRFHAPCYNEAGVAAGRRRGRGRRW
jgi:hypothetical protein